MIASWLLVAAALWAAPVELDWRAPPGCPSREYVLSEVARLVASASAPELRARAVVSRNAEGFRVLIELEGTVRGVRTLRARSCESIARATALIVALAIDPQAAAIVSEQAEAPAAEPAVTARETPATQAERPVEQRVASPVRHGVFLGFVGEQALLPRLAVGAEAGASVGWRFLRADLAAGGVPHARAALEEHPNVTGGFSLAYLRLRGCAGFIGASAALSGCAALRGSLLWAEASGAASPSEATARVLSVEPGILARMPGAVGIGAELAVALVIPVSRPRFVIAEGELQHELFRPGAIGMMVALGIHYDF